MKNIPTSPCQEKLTAAMGLKKNRPIPSFFSGQLKYFLLMVLVLLTAGAVDAQQQHLEDLSRGVVAVRTSSNQVFVSWRLLGNEPTKLGFNLYRGATKVNDTPIVASTNYIDNTSNNEEYTVRPVIDGVEQAASAPATVWGQQYLTIPLQRPAGGTTPTGEAYDYQANDASVGDLDGDGEYEIILKWNPSNAKDNSQQGYTGNVYLDAYEMDGTLLWRIDLGKNIRAGAHYTQFIVYDLDSDGKAEIGVKTAPNTKDGTGNFLSMGPAANDDDSKDHRTGGGWAGFVTEGPEYLTIFNGETGAEMATTNYVPDRYPTDGWGKSGDHTNRVDRFLAGVGYFDGEKPSLLMTRGYYGRSVLVAWDYRNGQLTQRWKFDTNDPGNRAYAGQGNHSLSINDVDGDGKDEVIFGSMAVDDDGTGLYTTGLGHGDAQHVGDLLPNRPGLESWSAHECEPCYDGHGLWLRDAGTGEKLWGVPATGDIGRGLSADIDPRYEGNEMWGSAGGLYSAAGELISWTKPTTNFAIWWDGDLQREILNEEKLDKWNPQNNSVSRLFTVYNTGANSINGSKATPNLTADILGDWREEMIFRHYDNTKLLLLTTTIPTSHKIHTLMHDPQYRVAVAWQNVAYNQPPHTSFFIGADMNAPLTYGDDPADFIPGQGAEGAAFSQNIRDLAPDLGADLTFAKGMGPGWLTIAADGTLSGTPLDKNTGANNFAVQVSNAEGIIELRILQINVEDINNPPVWNAETITTGTAVSGNNYQADLSTEASDSDSDTGLQFEKVSGPDWLAVAADGTISGIPQDAQLGENTFVVKTTDNQGASAEANLKIQVVPAALIHHYKFNDNANDSEGSKHGTTTGSPVFQQGVLGNSVVLDGTDDFVALPAGVANFQQLTVASWVKWNGGDNWQRIFDFGDNTESYMFLSPESGGDTQNLRFAIRTPEVGEQIVNAPPLTVDEWAHVAVTLSGTTAKLYVNGILVGENTAMGLMPNSLGNTSQNFIGESQWDDPLLDGRIDDFRIYNYPLSGAEIESLADQPIPKTAQTITFGALEPVRVGDADIEPAATASSGLQVTYTSSNTAVATIVDGKIHIVGPGTTSITATQEGNETFEAAAPVSQSLVVAEAKASQTITFAPIDQKKVGDVDFDPAAIASSGLAVTYSSSNTEVATVIDGKVHIVGEGTTTITAMQEGNDDFEAAEMVTQQLVVVKITSIPDNSVSGPYVSVFPNPSSGSYTIEMRDFKPGIVTLTVVNGNGKLILQSTIEVSNSRQVARINLEDFASGLYILKLKGNDTVTALKISLQR